MSVNTIKMNINGVEIANRILDHRECIKHFFALHYYIYNNMYMLDYPPESLFDDFILQEENECLLERHNESLDIVALHRKCAKHFIEVHYYINNNICMLDYPPELLFDNSILQEENECLLERTEDYGLEIEAIEKLKDKIEKTKEEYIQRKIKKRPPAFVGGYDKETKYVYADYSKAPPEKIHKQLQELVDIKVKEDKIAPVGQTKIDKETNKKSNTTGGCAEFQVVNEILLHNEKFYSDSKENNIDNIRLTFAVRLKPQEKLMLKLMRTGLLESTGFDVEKKWFAMLNYTATEHLPYCDNCKFMFEGKPTLKESFI